MAFGCICSAQAGQAQHRKRSIAQACPNNFVSRERKCRGVCGTALGYRVLFLRQSVSTTLFNNPTACDVSIMQTKHPCSRIKRVSELLPLFPLALVLFPGIALPLHIFEPRYKDMIGECLDHDSPFGI